MRAKLVANGIVSAVLLGVRAAPVSAQPPPVRPPQPPPVVSPEVSADRRITFRIRAPQADAVMVAAGDIPGNGRGASMTRDTDGLWTVTLGPIDPGAYRYLFQVNGVSVIDPVNPSTSESNGNVWSLVDVPGSEFMDTRSVPHGAVSAVTYYSTALSKFRRMHVYTPPGYDRGREKYPVFYLLHGAGDSDDSWTSVGRAGFILDNLIAAGKVVPMVVVMPAGHTRRFGFGAGAPTGPPPRADEFEQDFVTDVMPYIEKNYRVLTDRGHTAIAGLSMGGGQTLNLAFSHPDRFAYVGVFSSGIFGSFGPRRPGAASPPRDPRAEWEAAHSAQLDDARARRGLKLLWFSTGHDDFLAQTTQATIDLLKKHGFDPVFRESPGGHTWINWRNYLNEFAPQLFR